MDDPQALYAWLQANKPRELSVAVTQLTSPTLRSAEGFRKLARDYVVTNGEHLLIKSGFELTTGRDGVRMARRDGGSWQPAHLLFR